MGKIKYGKKDLIKKEEVDPNHVKERISIWVDESVVEAFRQRAQAENTKYQTLMNQALREFIEKPSLIERLERVEQQIKLLKTG